MRSKNINEIDSAELKNETTRTEWKELSDAELEKMSGAVSSAISEVMKNFGGALNTAAR